MSKSSLGLVGLAPRRKAAGYTQEAFADALGVTRSALAMWETGSIWPSAGLLPKMADLLLCSIDDLYRLPPEGVVIEFPVKRVDPDLLEALQNMAEEDLSLFREVPLKEED